MKLVGYRGQAFGGGAFPSEQHDPRAAAAEHFTEENLGTFPEGMDAIKECRITDWERQQAWVLERVGDPTTPEGWRLVESGRTDVEMMQMLDAVKDLVDEDGREKLEEMKGEIRSRNKKMGEER